MKGRSSEWRLRAAALALGAALSVALGELALRAAGVEYPIFFHADPVTGTWHIPDISGTYTLEGRAFVSMNSVGMRDGEHTVAKPPDAYRVAVVGDSYAEALQVDADETFWALMEERLGACPGLAGRRPELLNFGVSGFGTAQELLTLRHRAAAYSPDVVLLPFVPNDVRDNHRGIARNPTAPYFVLEDGELVLDRGFLDSERYRAATSAVGRLKIALRSRSRVVQLVYEANAVRQRLDQAPARHGLLDAPVFAPPETPEWREAWTVTELLIESVAMETAAIGALLLIGVVTDGRQVDPDPDRRRVRSEALGVDDLFYYEDRVLGLAARLGIPAIGLGRPFLAEAERTGECLHGFANARPCEGHWNERGHRLAGALLADAVCEASGRSGIEQAARPVARGGGADGTRTRNFWRDRPVL